MLAQQVASGLAMGCLYALAALGLVLIYKTSDMVNFAQGEMSMISTFVAYTFLSVTGLPFAAAFILAVIFAGLFGMAVERALLRPIQNAPVITLMIVTLGLYMIFNGIAGWIWGYDPQSFPYAMVGRPLVVGGVIISRDSLLVMGVTLFLMVVLYLMLRFSLAGIAMRATAQNAVVARLMGVPVKRVHSWVWGISAGLGAVAGILIAPTTFLDPNMMAEMNIKAFTAAVLGGFSSLPGAVVGGLLLGVLENLVAGYISTEFKSTFAFGLIIIVLWLRPHGLLGAHHRKKV